MSSHPDVSIVIVSFKTRELTLACLESVATETPDLPHEVIVVDNASGDGTAEAIRSDHPTVRVIENDVNVGFGHAVRQAVDASEGNYVLLLNSDAVIVDRTIERLHAWAEAHPDRGLYGPRTIHDDGSLEPSCCFARPSIAGLAVAATGLSTLLPDRSWSNPEDYGGWDRRDNREVDILQGSCLLIRRTVWDALDGFDRRYWMYGEDADLCLRAAAAGWRPTLVGEIEVVHHLGGSDVVEPDRRVRLLTARRMLLADHLPTSQRGLGWRLVKAGVAVRAGAAHLLRRMRGGELHAWGEVWARRAEWDTDSPKWALGGQTLAALQSSADA